MIDTEFASHDRRPAVSANPFDRDSAARSYAARHFKLDAGVRDVYYLPAGAPDREIRLVEVNELIAERQEDPLEPIDFGVDIGRPDGHSLIVLDITPGQWDRIQAGHLRLPPDWSREGAVLFARAGHE